MIAELELQLQQSWGSSRHQILDSISLFRKQSIFLMRRDGAICDLTSDAASVAQYLSGRPKIEGRMFASEDTLV
jgi:hypothetical protein